jgi:hypothetical protein
MKKKVLVPAVVFQQPDDISLVEGENTQRLDLWERELESVIGGALGAIGDTDLDIGDDIFDPDLGARPPRRGTRCQWGPRIRVDD